MGKYLKAIIALFVGGLGSLSTGLLPDPDGVSRLTWPEIIASIVAAVVAFGGTAAVTNAGTIHVDKLPPAGELAREAYEAYAQAVGGRAVNGDVLPEWSKLTIVIRDAWTRAQVAVTSLLQR